MESDIYYLDSESNVSMAPAPASVLSHTGWHWTAEARWQVVLPVGPLCPSAAIFKLQAISLTDTEACSCALWGGGHELNPVLNWDKGDGWETVLSSWTTRLGGRWQTAAWQLPTRLPVSLQFRRIAGHPTKPQVRLQRDSTCGLCGPVLGWQGPRWRLFLHIALLLVDHCGRKLQKEKASGVLWCWLGENFKIFRLWTSFYWG